MAGSVHPLQCADGAWAAADLAVLAYSDAAAREVSGGAWGAVGPSAGANIGRGPSENDLDPRGFCGRGIGDQRARYLASRGPAGFPRRGFHDDAHGTEV